MTGQSAVHAPGIQLRPAGSLVDRALARLALGPASTPALAADVLALRGNPHAAAAAVFALLGTDDRVNVDGAGVWSLASPPVVDWAGSLQDVEWTVVDVETTGGSPAHGHRVIEIAAVRVAGGRVAGSFSTLVNPGRPIPRMITSLTGIGNDHVVAAPRFEEILPDLTDAIAGRVFVGHNASFDWRFVCAEMERTGSTLGGRKVCTLRIARRILPHLPSRSLGALAHYFGIDMEVHHRALDDAVATAEILIRFLESLEEREITTWETLEAFFRTRAPKRRRTALPRPVDAA